MFYAQTECKLRMASGFRWSSMFQEDLASLHKFKALCKKEKSSKCLHKL